ncbi:hypothetical protein [Pseudomonas reidholzensis]|uniref:hypothetical protein n=1 Tax=Pseudomonas reidholzensis TaxID=1785162 RepID=UPI0011C39288|nr:hypothetical protein [Pseudomonas reidholzensis]
MAFGSLDTQALEAARVAGIRTENVDHKDSTHVVITLTCPRNPDTPEPAKVLARAIEASDRFMENVTVCVLVEGPAPVPPFIQESIEYLKGYPVKLIIVCDGATTHAPGALLDEILCKKVNELLPGGAMWHPLADLPVWENP